LIKDNISNILNTTNKNKSSNNINVIANTLDINSEKIKKRINNRNNNIPRNNIIQLSKDISTIKNISNIKNTSRNTSRTISKNKSKVNDSSVFIIFQKENVKKLEKEIEKYNSTTLQQSKDHSISLALVDNDKQNERIAYDFMNMKKNNIRSIDKNTQADYPYPVGVITPEQRGMLIIYN
jgi:hypothetical protein